MTDQMNKDKQTPLSFCTSNFCEGEPLDIQTEDIDNDMECSICYEPFTNGCKVLTILNPCMHVFCKDCYAGYDHCPMCRSSNCTPFFSNIPVKRFTPINASLHKECPMKTKYIKAFISELRDTPSFEYWMILLRFMFETSNTDQRFFGLKGIVHLNMDSYKNQGTFVEESASHYVQKMENNNNTVLIGCSIPKMSLKLIVSSNEDIDFDVNNEYADTVVEILSKQISACWKVLPLLISKCKDNITRIHVRKFKNFTASLMVQSFANKSETYVANNHCKPMEKELSKIEKCNFDIKHFDSFRLKYFPTFKLQEMEPPKGYSISGCCNSKKK